MGLAFEKAAATALRRMPGAEALALSAELGAIAADPFAPHAGVERMEGTRQGFRLRQGDWRAVHVVDRAAGELRVVRIGHRREVYR
jgi:mRNA-degrading endonuclease RelE of RelBE toxin-antitoxin system